jgi:hypothetical protein
VPLNNIFIVASKTPIYVQSSFEMDRPKTYRGRGGGRKDSFSCWLDERYNLEQLPYEYESLNLILVIVDVKENNCCTYT